MIQHNPKRWIALLLTLMLLVGIAPRSYATEETMPETIPVTLPEVTEETTPETIPEPTTEATLATTPEAAPEESPANSIQFVSFHSSFRWAGRILGRKNTRAVPGMDGVAIVRHGGAFYGRAAGRHRCQRTAESAAGSEQEISHR